MVGLGTAISTDARSRNLLSEMALALVLNARDKGHGDIEMLLGLLVGDYIKRTSERS